MTQYMFLKNKPDPKYGLYQHNIVHFAEENIGITWLTGEACNLSMRGLCKMNSQAWRLFFDFHGIRHIDPSQQPETMFLSRTDIEELTIFFLCHFYGYIVELITKDSNLFRKEKSYLCFNSVESWTEVRNQNPDLYDRYDDCKLIEGSVYSIGRTYYSSSNPHVGFSNIHAIGGFHQ